MAKAQCQTIRLRLLKMGARVRLTVRKIWISLAAGHPAAGHPAAGLFEQVYEKLGATVALGC
jgi:hypothetical protein